MILTLFEYCNSLVAFFRKWSNKYKHEKMNLNSELKKIDSSLTAYITILSEGMLFSMKSLNGESCRMHITHNHLNEELDYEVLDWENCFANPEDIFSKFYGNFCNLYDLSKELVTVKNIVNQPLKFEGGTVSAYVFEYYIDVFEYYIEFVISNQNNTKKIVFSSLENWKPIFENFEEDIMIETKKNLENFFKHKTIEVPKAVLDVLCPKLKRSFPHNFYKMLFKFFAFFKNGRE